MSENTYSVKIDYNSELHCVFIKRINLPDRLWNNIYSIIVAYIPTEAVTKHENNIDFSWRLFISIAPKLGKYFRTLRNEFSVSYTDIAKKYIETSLSVSYPKALEIPHRTTDEINAALEQRGFTRKLSDNQLNNLLKISQLPSAATFSVPGAGKTTEALAYFFINSIKTDKLLVVAPKNAFVAWDQELKDCVPDIKDQFVRLRGKDRIYLQLSQNPKFSIISYDQFVIAKDDIYRFVRTNSVFMFLDESHRIKGGKKVKRADSILELAYLPCRKLVMSGTPMPQSEKDLISQFNFLYPETEVTQNDVIDRFQPIFVRTTKAQLGIPKVHRTIVPLEMDSLQRDLYKSLKSEVAREINPLLSDFSKASLRKIGKCIMKIMQFVSNPSLLSSDLRYIFNNKLGDLLLKTDGPKIQYVCARARKLAAEKKKVVIWSCFVKNVELIASRLVDLDAVFIHGGVDAGDDNDFETREGRIKKFLFDPKCMILVANPAACSEGISLHKTCHNAIYLDRSFNAAHYLQSEDRIHRFGIKEAPEIEIVTCKNSIDEVINTRLQYKVSRMADALNDSSLHIEPDDQYYADDETEFIEDSLTEDDAIAIRNYFFSTTL